MAIQYLDKRFWEKVDRGAANGCWNWTASLKSRGYGRFYLNGKYHLAHRISYETLCGDVPDGLQLDHLCRNRSCVNPTHLEPVTCRENLLRGDTFNAKNASKTICPLGHAYSGVYVDKRGHTLRTCKKCRADREARRRERLRSQEVGHRHPV